MSHTHIRRHADTPNLTHITTAVTDEQLLQAADDILSIIIERNVTKLVDLHMPAIEKLVVDTMLGIKYRERFRQAVEEAIKASVEKVVREMLNVHGSSSRREVGSSL